MISGRLMWKVSLVGGLESGKSSLISRIVFDSETGNFINKGLLRKKVSFQENGKDYHAELILQEISGFPTNEKLLAGSSAIIIVVDVTKKMNEQEIINFIRLTQKRGLIIMAANKVDRKYEAVTWKEDLEPIAKKFDLDLYMVSAKQPDTVNNMVNGISRLLIGRINGKQ
ncbi:MAG: GTPase domain-containing protein [Candidatus Thermoplasmatota archaeon]|nr:GTPase domain-containing protein [Candidatus Thermoplasmatota archaeon]MCL5889383.1 GTPase domain-containing protein [Candidatus Thermoplasmatota archaeon]